MGGPAKVRVVAPDMRGVNRTSPKYDCAEMGCANYKPETIAAEIGSLLTTHFGASSKKVHLVGHDWGSAIAWYLAVKQPELLASFTAISVTHPTVWNYFMKHEEASKGIRDSYVPH